jgi:hypothetical protein
MGCVEELDVFPSSPELRAFVEKVTGTFCKRMVECSLESNEKGCRDLNYPLLEEGIVYFNPEAVDDCTECFDVAYSEMKCSSFKHFFNSSIDSISNECHEFCGKVIIYEK